MFTVPPLLLHIADLALYSSKAVYGALMRLVCRPGRLFRLFLPPRTSSPNPNTPHTKMAVLGHPRSALARGLQEL